MNKTALSREQLGSAIAQIEGAVKRINEAAYIVKSQSGNGDYEIRSTDLGWFYRNKVTGYRLKRLIKIA